MSYADEEGRVTDAITRRFAPLHPRLIDLSLARIERLLAEMGSPQTRLPPVIHVAGTNGKGSTIAFLRAILEAAGKRVHVYTSPHLVRFHERIRLAGTLVDDMRLDEMLDRVERINAGQAISVFEITTAVALQLFVETPADYLLLEVGLGGRFDATNVIAKPEACIITPISLDHAEFLGSTLDKIAYEKAGILKKGVLAVIAAQQEAAQAVIEREALRVGASLSCEGRDYEVREEHGRLAYEDVRGLLDLPRPRLRGRHQLGNAAAAIAVLRATASDLPTQAYEQGLMQVQWPARLQSLQTGLLIAHAPMGAEIWLDGAHNEAGGRVVSEAMADLETSHSRPLILICGTLANKDTAAFLEHFQELAAALIAVPVPSENSRPTKEVAEMAQAIGIKAEEAETVVAALERLKARAWPHPPRILITGSLYLAGAVLDDNGTPPV